MSAAASEGMLTVGVVPHPTKDISVSLATVRRFTADHPARLVALRRDAVRVGEGWELLEVDAFTAEVDAVIALGGDGTMLGAMRLVADRPVPVLGVNYGNVGFLVEVEPDELADALARLQAEDFQLEPHHAVEVVVRTDDREETFLAFNDVAIARRPGQGVVSADLTVDDRDYGFYKADAIVVATSTGSTAYNYSAGGPILSPALAASVVTPVASMAGIDRPLVLSHKEVLRLDVGPGTRGAAVEIDGRVVTDVADGSELRLRLRRNAGSVFRMDADRHSHKGRVKLSLLDLPLRPHQLRELLPGRVRDAFDARD